MDLLGVILPVDPVTALVLLWIGAMAGFAAALLVFKEAR